MKKILPLLLFWATSQNVAAQIMVSTARPAEKIEANYPFDIALRSPDSVATNTKIVLPQNGRPTLLAFWLTTCMPCMMELDAYAKKYAAWMGETPFNLIAVSTDFPRNFNRIGQVWQQKKMPFLTFWDENREFREILPGGLNGLPQVFLFDKNGKLVWQHRKFYSGVEDEMFRQVQNAY